MNTVSLAEFDAALDRLAHSMLGACESCDGLVEPDQLMADPLAVVADRSPEKLVATAIAAAHRGHDTAHDDLTVAAIRLN